MNIRLIFCGEANHKKKNKYHVIFQLEVTLSNELT